jgi:benzoyl-CoA reductase subunit B
MSNQLWETRPLECWGKAKELRAKWQNSIDDSGQSSYKLLAHGNAGHYDWSVAFPALTIIEDNPAGAMIANKSDEFARKCRLASETRGWGREICGYVQNCWGSQFLGYQADGSPFPLRDMCVPFPDPCDQHLKRGQQCMDLSPIPRWGADMPLYTGEQTRERDAAMVEHRVQCYVTIVRDIERIFGQKFDEEEFIKALNVRIEVEKCAQDVSRFMCHIPTPIGQKDLNSFYTIGGLTKVDPEETVALWRAFRDEVEWRVQNNIAALATERYRWMEAHPSPWHFLKYYRYMEKYGAICIGSQYTHMMSGPLRLNEEDGLIGPRPKVRPPADQPIRTLEDAFRFVFMEGSRYPHGMKVDEYCRPYVLVEFAKAFKVNGAVMPLWRGGVGCTLTRKEQGLRLSEAGVSVLHYEGSQPGDRTDLDEKRFMDQLDIWMEYQGLRKISD